MIENGHHVQNLIFQGMNAMNDQKHDFAIDLLSQALFSALDLRCIAFEKCGNYKAALQDAQIMTDLFSTESLGYMRTGHLLCSRSYFEQAIKVYEKGLKAVDENNVGYCQLKDAKAEAERVLNRRLDLIHILPSDIVSLIASQLRLHDLVHCAAVSKAWRSAVLGIPELWRTIHGDLAKQKPQQLLWHVNHVPGDFVRSISVVANPSTMETDRDMLAQFFTTMIENKFCFVSHLSLCKITFPPDVFLKLMWLMGDSLKELVLYDTNVSHGTLFGSVLRICPYLKSISYHVLHDSGPVIIPALYTRYPEMTNLHLSFPKHKSQIHLNAVLDCFPNLRHLFIRLPTHYDTEEITLIALHSCTYLSTLYINHTGDYQTLPQLPSPVEPQGLCNVHITNSNERHSVSDETLTFLFENHSTTLERVALDIDQESSALPWLTLASYGAPQLRQLTLTDCLRPDFSMSTLALAIDACPALQFLELNLFYLNSIDLFPVLSRLTKLSSLSIGDCLIHDHDICATLCDMFMTAPPPALQVIDFSHLDFLSDEILYAISHVSTLQVLSITESVGITRTGVMQVVDSIQGLLDFTIIACPSVDHITLEYVERQIQNRKP